MLAVCLGFACGKGDSDKAKTRSKTKLSAGPPTADARAPKRKAKTIEERAAQLAQQLIIVDGHVDLPYRLMEGKKEHGKIVEDVSARTAKGNFDFPRARAGGLNAPFMSIYIPAEYQTKGGAKKLADELIDMVEGLAKQHPDKFAIARSPADIEAQFKRGVVSLPMGIENGAAIEKDLKNLKHFYDRGVRYITLTHSKDNAICDSSYATTHTHKGLSAFGKKVVAEMNRLGIMVDVSHISDDAFHQVLAATKVPVIASHSSLRHFVPGFERDMTDAMVKQLAANGGVVMINFGSGFLNKQANDIYAQFREAHAAFEAGLKKQKLDDKQRRAREKKFYAEFKKSHKMIYATVSQVADHIQRVVKLVGIDHVGLGSDFDGVGDSLPVGLKDVSQYPNLIAELLRRKLSPADIAKITSGNVLRVWRKVQAYAEAQRKVDKAANATPKRPLGSGAKDAVARAVHGRYLHDIRSCYKLALLRKPNAAGKIKLEFVIGANGRIKQSRVKGFDKRVDRCIQLRMARWQFAPPKQSSGETHTVNVTLHRS